MENIGVARLMLDKFGPENVPHLTDLSVHNHRIEQLCGDVVTYCSTLQGLVRIYGKYWYFGSFKRMRIIFPSPSISTTIR